MLFENLTNNLSKIFDNLTKRGALKEADVEAALREIRIALLDADVDRLTNLQEYAAGTDPNDAESGLKLELMRLPNGMLRVSFEAVEGRSYSLQAALALGQEWQSLSDFYPKTSTKVTRTLSPRVSPERFFRLVTPAKP